MSMQGGFGAASAVSEILRLIEAEQKNGLSAEEVLEKVVERAKEIKKAGEDGWY